MQAFKRGLAFLGRAFMGVCPRVGVMPPSFCGGEAGLASPPRGLAATLRVCPACVLKPSEKSWFSLCLHSCPPRTLRVFSATLGAGASLRTVSILSLLGPGHKFSHFFQVLLPATFPALWAPGGARGPFRSGPRARVPELEGYFKDPLFFRK